MEMYVKPEAELIDFRADEAIMDWSLMPNAEFGPVSSFESEEW